MNPGNIMTKNRKSYIKNLKDAATWICTKMYSFKSFYLEDILKITPQTSTLTDEQATKKQEPRENRKKRNNKRKRTI